jgi:hypothetical protein
MGCKSKGFSLLLVIVLAVSSLIMIEPATAQTPTASPVPIPTPSVPTFTVQLVGPPYIKPTTFQLDQNTGQIVANIGYSNEFSAVELTIKNQPLVFDYSNVHLIGAFGFYYNIQIKPHSSSGDWTDIYHAWDYGYGVPSNSEYTTLSFSIEGQMGVGVLAGTQIDIQVQAMIGSIGRDAGSIPAPWVFRGQTSAWSNAQTINIPANTPLSANSPSPTSSSNPAITPTSTPTATNSTGNPISVPLNTLIAVVVVFLAIIVALSLLLFRKHRKTISQNKPSV